jgi:hypothetical protein
MKSILTSGIPRQQQHPFPGDSDVSLAADEKGEKKYTVFDLG